MVGAVLHVDAVGLEAPVLSHLLVVLPVPFREAPFARNVDLKHEAVCQCEDNGSVAATMCGSKRKPLFDPTIPPSF